MIFIHWVRRFPGYDSYVSGFAGCYCIQIFPFFADRGLPCLRVYRYILMYKRLNHRTQYLCNRD